MERKIEEGDGKGSYQNHPLAWAYADKNTNLSGLILQDKVNHQYGKHSPQKCFLKEWPMCTDKLMSAGETCRGPSCHINWLVVLLKK